MAYGLIGSGNFNPYPAAGAGSGLMQQNLARGGSAPLVLNPPTVATVPKPTDLGGTASADAQAAGQSVYSQLPGYAGDIGAIGSTVSSEVAGQLPADVQAQLQQQAAERGVTTGSPGSDNSTAAYLRALGLNSLQLQQTGQQNLNTQTAALPGAAISQNPSFYATPALTQQAASQNAAAQTEANFQQAGLNAAQAGVAAGSAGGGGAPALSVGPLPPTPSTSASSPTGAGILPYAGVIPGYDSGSDGSNSDTGNLLNQIIQAYSGTVDPAQGEQGNNGFDYFGSNLPGLGGSPLESMLGAAGATTGTSSTGSGE